MSTICLTSSFPYSLPLTDQQLCRFGLAYCYYQQAIPETFDYISGTHYLYISETCIPFLVAVIGTQVGVVLRGGVGTAKNTRNRKISFGLVDPVK